jgi:hypothetical protein
MENRPTSGFFSGISVLSLIFGFGFLLVSLILWWFMRQRILLPFGVAMFFGGIANSLTCLVLHRMETAGYQVGYWRWFSNDFKLYSEYWRIAPSRGWSRITLGGAVVCFLLAAVFLFFPAFAGYRPPR